MSEGADVNAEIEVLVSPGAQLGGAGTVADARLDTGLDITLALPGITVAVEHMVAAVVLELTVDAAGTLALAPRFRLDPPTGARAELEMAAVTGGGYLQRRGDDWAGALAADLGPAAVTGLFLVGQAGGATSFLAVLGIRFVPGIQLGFGFELTGVGGLIGVNRRADVDLLRERLASGAAGNVLFCEDPVANAPTILGDLARFFPAAPGRLIVGPTLQISWIRPIVRLDAAVLIELPGPSKIIILGTLRVLIGADENVALLYLRMDFLGVLDFEKQLVSLDAQLVNSHALGVFRLTGGMAFRMFYGANPYVLLTIGGFHPRFDPGPLNLPVIPRVGAVLDVPCGAFLRLELYTAFTPNTLQAGALVEAGLRLGPISASGHFQFDGLITFRPFTFDIEFSAGFAVRALGVSLCSVGVSGRLTGPGPLVVHAQASVKVLLVRVRGSATIELGRRNGDAVSAIPSVVQALSGELGSVHNLHTDGNDGSVRLRRSVSRPAGGVALAYPTGTLRWKQKRAPLNTTIDRFEGVPIAGGAHLLRVDGPAGATPETEWFSPGSFTTLDLKASQTLNNAGYEQLDGGLRLDNGAPRDSGDARNFTNDIDLVKVPSGIKLSANAIGNYLPTGLAAALAERDTTPPLTGSAPAVAVAPETFTVIGADGATVHQELTGFGAFQLARQQPGAIAVPGADVPVTL